MSNQPQPFYAVRRSVFALALAIMGLILPERGAAQPTDFRYYLRVPNCISFTPRTPCGEGSSDLRLYSDWPTRGLDTVVAAGRIVTRQVKAGEKTVTVVDTLREPLTVQRDTFSVWEPGERATIYVDSDDKSKLHVNFWLPEDDTVDVNGTRVSRDSVRKTDYYFRLANRQTVRFSSRAVSVGATTIPLRLRPGYTAGNGSEIPANVATDVNVNVFVGYTWGGARYTYLRDAEENSIQQDRAITLGGSLGLSSTEVDSTTSRSADTPLLEKRSIGVLSPAATVLMRINGIEFGVFGGLEFGVGRGAGSWDYNRRPWFGLGLGFGLLKLGKSD